MTTRNSSSVTRAIRLAGTAALLVYAARTVEAQGTSIPRVDPAVVAPN